MAPQQLDAFCITKTVGPSWGLYAWKALQLSQHPLTQKFSRRAVACPQFGRVRKVTYRPGRNGSTHWFYDTSPPIFGPGLDRISHCECSFLPGSHHLKATRLMVLPFRHSAPATQCENIWHHHSPRGRRLRFDPLKLRNFRFRKKQNTNFWAKLSQVSRYKTYI